MSNRRSYLPWVLLPVLPLLALATPGGAKAFDGVRPGTESPREDELHENVAELVELLGSPKRIERRDGEQRLLELGPAALRHLPPTSRLGTAAEREAVRRIRRELELRAARESIRASRVTLRRETTLRELLAEIERQTGNGFDVGGVDEDRLSRSMAVDLRSVPFWKVVDEQLPTFGVRFDSASSGKVVALVDGEPDEETDAAVSHFESFRIRTTPLRRRALFGDDDHDLLRSSIVLHVEPRLRPLFARYRGDSLVVQDESGDVLPPLSPSATLDTPVTGRRLAPRWDVRVPTNEAAESVSLRGAIVLTIAAGEEVIRFPTLDQTRNVARRRAGVVVRTTSAELREGDEGGRRVVVGVTVSYDEGGPAFESHRTWVFHNDVRLEDSRGRAVSPSGPPTIERGEDGAVAVQYRFAGLAGKAEDYRFVYVAPTLVVDVPVAFSRNGVLVQGDGAER